MQHYMKDKIEYHSDNMYRPGNPAINVKCYKNLDSEGLTEKEANFCWESVLEWWWGEATDIAHEYGYSGVFSEGRSGGWLIPYYQNGKKYYNWPGQGGNLGYPSYPDVTQFGERSRFLAFQRKIKKLLEQVPEMFKEEVKCLRLNKVDDNSNILVENSWGIF